MEIRETTECDYADLQVLYPRAFPGEDLLPLVKALLQQTSGTLSLVAVENTIIIGHVIFTSAQIENDPHTVALLGPLAVLPERQRQGVGSALVHAGLKILGKADVSHVYVLGDPVYYRRFGFTPDSDVTPPYTLPDEWRGAWQSRKINTVETAPSGQIVLPDPWLQPGLWAL